MLHRVLNCDVAALLTAHPGVASLMLVTWSKEAGQAPARFRSDASVWVLAAHLPRRPEVAVLWRGCLDVAPPGCPPLRCQLVVPLLLDQGGQSAWLIGRATDFCHEEVEHAELLAPGLRQQFARIDEPGAARSVLTARERDVLALVARGMTSRAVAHRLGISGRTVQKHLEHAYGKLGCCDRLSAVLRARAEGLIAA